MTPGKIALTMGCPAGVGPEIALRFWLSHDHAERFQPLLVGDLGVLRHTAKHLALNIPFSSWQPGQPLSPDSLNVYPVSNLSPIPLWGKPTPQSGKAMGQYIARSVELVQAGEALAIVTCPVSKDMLNSGGFYYPGHTEMIAELCGSAEYAMMMAGSRLRVILLTIHQPLAGVAAALDQDSLLKLIKLAASSLRRDFAIEKPRIAVAGFNPHAGEGGMFGLEEERVIAPAVDLARKTVAGQGISLSGPHPPDTVFYQAANGGYDAVIAIYHDQGLIPFKLLHFNDGVNVSIGLPLVRTSVDHGTAYDIAGKGVADYGSLAAAFKLAGVIVENRCKYPADNSSEAG